MNATTPETTTATLGYHFGEPVEMTADDLRLMANLLDMVGLRVRRTDRDGRVFEGILTSVYVTDGIAVNIHGEDGTSFDLGPLYGATVEAAS